MKKRFISLMCVLVIVFCGAFSCFVSADSSTSQRLFDLYERYFRSVGEFIWDQTIFGDYERLKQFLGEQKSAIDSQGDVGGCLIYYANQDKWFAIDVVGYSGSNATLRDCVYFAIVENYNTDSYASRSNLGSAYCVAVPSQYAANVSFSFDGTYYSLFCSGPIIYHQYTLKLQLDSHDNPITYLYNNSITTRNASSGQFYLNNITVSPTNYVCKKLGVNDFDSTQINFFGSSDLDGNILHLDLTSNREIVESVDGTFLISAGILYDDGVDRMYAGEYTNFQNAASGDHWSWDYDLNGLSYYLYRKRCPLENYMAYIFVYQNGFVYSIEFPIELEPPGGIFDDIDYPPNWRDYEPEPSEDPEPPTFDPNKIFQYSPTNNTYQSFSWTTINNYNFGSDSSSGGGGGGSGGDSSSGSGDDSSSGGDDSGGDSSSGSDSGGGGSFSDWFSDAVVTINNNFSSGLDTLNENIRIIKDNTENYFTAVHDYIEDYLHDWFVYIADLLKKFKYDFNAWTSAFGVYLDDCFDTLNHNIVVVGDNIVKAIKTQVVPDKDVLYDIASSNFPIVDQVNTSLSDFSVEDKSLIVSIPLFGSHEEPAAYFVNQSFNSDGQLRGGSDSGESISINYVSGDCLTFNLTDIFTRYDIPRFRSVGSLFILGSTFWSLINITFKIFGLGFFRDVQLYGGALE